MISVITCSKKLDQALALKDNIATTIGLPHEVIIIDNTSGHHSLFSAYNEGVAKSRFSNLCFVHDDVQFEEEGWGLAVCRHLEQPNAGIIGLCGSPYQTHLPASWSFYGWSAYIIQSDRNRTLRIFEPSEGYDDNHEKPVVTLDGVFFCASKALFERIHFDEQTYSGFHLYDLDICMQAHNLGFTNKVINDVLLIHYSRGRHDADWVKNCLLFSEKWQSILPAAVEDIPVTAIEAREYRYLKKTFIKNLIYAGYSNDDCRSIVLKLLAHPNCRLKGITAQTITRWVLWVRLNKKPSSLLFPPRPKLPEGSPFSFHG